MTYASVGNIEVRFLNVVEPVKIIVRRGIIGLNAPNPVVTENIWNTEGIMMLFSDGIRTHWRWEDYPGLWEKSANDVARELLLSLAKNEDDATIVLVRGKPK